MSAIGGPLWQALKKRTHEVIEKAADNDRLSRVVDVSLALLIITNVLAVILETVGPVRARIGYALRAFDVFSLAIFTAEYVLRVWSCTAEIKFSRPIVGRLRYMAQPMMILDLLVILPFYLPGIVPYADLRYGRAFRLLRLIRIVRIGRYSSSLSSLGRVFVRKKEELVIAFVAEIIMLIVAASMLYFVEAEAQPDDFSSIPAAMWWSVSTLTTVGYGDIVPVTGMGRALAMVIAMVGVAMFALPVGILGAGFVEVMEEQEMMKRTGRLENPNEGGYVLLNFPGVARFHALVEEICYIEPDVSICVLDDTLDELPTGVADIPNVHFIRGSILDRRAYEKARIRDCKVVIVFPTESGIPDSDGTTRTVVDLVSTVVSEETRVLHVLVSAENEWMFEGLNSTSVMESLETLALVQECQDRHSAQIVQRLLLNTKGGNPNTVAPRGVIGWTWNEFTIACAEAAAESDTMANPLALVKPDGPLVCPPAAARIEEGDLLSIVSVPGFEWEAFEAKMVETRSRRQASS